MCEQHSTELTIALDELRNKVEDYVRHFPGAPDIKPPNPQATNGQYVVSITSTGKRLQRVFGSGGYIVRWKEDDRQKLDVNFPPGGDQPVVNPTGLSDLESQSLVRRLTEIIDLAIMAGAFSVGK